MKQVLASIVLFTAIAASADQWLESLDIPLSGDRVVINDKTYVLLSEEDFVKLQNKYTFFSKIASNQWKKQHATEQGRNEWHGAKVNTIIKKGDDGLDVKIIEYADGYRWEEKRPGKNSKLKVNKSPLLKNIHVQTLDQLKAAKEKSIFIKKEVK